MILTSILEKAAEAVGLSKRAALSGARCSAGTTSPSKWLRPVFDALPRSYSGCSPWLDLSTRCARRDLLLRDDIQPVEVHRLRVADHRGQRRRQVEDVLGGVSADGLAGSDPIAVLGELGREGLLGDLHAGCSHN